MAGRKGAKIGNDNMESSMAAAVAAIAKISTGVVAATITTLMISTGAEEPTTLQVQGGETRPSGRPKCMLEGHVREVIIDQIVIEDEDGEIPNQARDLRRLDIYQHQILKLQHEKDQLLNQATT
jgi:hypothetical protein